MTRRRLLMAAGILVTALVLGLTAAFFVLDEPRPGGEPGEAADALARDMMKAIDHEAWLRTRAVSWRFAGRHEHLWDRDRSLIRVKWDAYTVWADLQTRKGIAHRDGAAVPDGEVKALVEKAIAFWVNDSFWLNPISKFFDDGVIRSIVKTDDGPGLLISFGDVGLTPGDAYLWHVGEDGRPTRWQIWASIVPVGGLEATWSGWKTLSTGAWVSETHKLGGVLDLLLEDISGAATLSELLPGKDPFAVLVGGA